MSTPSRVLTAARTLTAVKGKSLFFDGTDDMVDCGNDESLNFDDTNEFTIELWLYPKKETDDYDVLGKWTWSGWKGYFVYYSWETLKISVGHGDDTSTLVYFPRVTKDNWHHVAFTVTASELKAYLNGNLKNTEPLSKSIVYCDSSLILSPPGWTGVRLNGTIPLVRIYERALSPAEVVYNKEHPHNPVLHGCVLWLDYDSVDEAAGMWYDKTSYGNDGVVYGATAVEMNKLAGRVLSV
ncbi:MAG: LamG domain-containing protein [Methanophagales archaeon]|nr:LamG domain-containing protein [Methanophagales archaeon]